MIDKNISIDELIIQFIGDQFLTDGTRRQYRLVISLFFNWVESEGYNPYDINRGMVAKYIAQLFDRKIASTTVHNYISIIRVFFKWTNENNIHPNIVIGIRNPKKERGFKKQPLNIKQVRQLLRSIPTDTLKGLRDFAMANLMVRTGLRAIELSRANIEDLTKRENKTVLMIQGKGRYSKDLFVRLEQNGVDPIRKYLNKRKFKNDRDPLFASIVDELWVKPLKSTSISRIITQKMRGIGLNSKEYTCHSLRHTAAVLSLDGGGELYRVQLMLRHSSPLITQLYTVYAEEKLRLENQPGKIIDIMIGKI